MLKPRFSSLFLFSAMIFGSLFAAQQAQAHACIEALILRSPEVVHTGETFPVTVGMFNCGGCDTAVNVDLFLVRNSGRIHIGEAQTRLRIDTRDILRVRCTVPRDIRSGRYSLVMAARTPSGYMDLDRRKILVLDHDVRRRSRDLDLVIDHVLDSHADSLDEDGLANMVDDILGAEVGEGELGNRTVMPVVLYFRGTVTSVTRDRNDNITKFSVQKNGGASKTFIVDNNTTFPQGDAIENKDVKVTYTEVQGVGNVASSVEIP
ncbi:MAG: hypothetical protein VX715_04215 [Planctomycetota bacterium]|nr:hypothetical protein [Planctomycetota bacterium]